MSINLHYHPYINSKNINKFNKIRQLSIFHTLIYISMKIIRNQKFLTHLSNLICLELAFFLIGCLPTCDFK